MLAMCSYAALVAVRQWLQCPAVCINLAKLHMNQLQHQSDLAACSHCANLPTVCIAPQLVANV